MTTVAAPAISVRIDEHPGEWRTFFHLHAVDELVETIVTGPPANAAPYVRGHREIHLGERPYDPLHPQMAPMMLVAASVDGGAVYFRDLDPDGHPLGFIARGDGRANAPRLPFNAQGSIDFAPEDVLSRDRLRLVVRAYLLDGRRPEITDWRESDWVQ